jgi:hypothetical protein
LIFHFFEFKFKFELGGGGCTAGYRYRTPAVTAVTAVYRVVPSGKKNPGLSSQALLDKFVRLICFEKKLLHVDLICTADLF